MAQLLLIKTADTIVKTVGDIVGVFLDTHKFSDHEKEVFDITYIEGKREDVVAKLDALRVPVERAYKAKTTEWSRERSEEKEVWKDVDGKWYFMEIRPKYKYSTALLTTEEKTTLAKDSIGLARDAAFEKMVVNPGVWDAKNKVEATDLNKVVIK